MDADSLSSEALPLLARLYRERRSGVLSLGPDDAPLRVLLRDGHVVGLGPVAPPQPASRAGVAGADESAGSRLERVLVEIGIRAQPKAPPPPPGLSASDLRERLIQALVDGSVAATFVDGAEAPPDVAEAAGATEPLILEAVRELRDAEAVRATLGNLDQRLVATAALADERTLTLTEGYLLSRIDGTSSARQVLQLVPLDPDETERTLLGLLLTGRVEYRAAPAPRVPRRPEAVASPTASEPPPAAEATGEAGGPPSPSPDEAFPQVSLIEEGPPAEPEGGPPPAPLDPETREQKREIFQAFQSLPLKNHFEVLGVEPGCTDADVKRAYMALVKRYHPDVHSDPRLEDMQDFLGAILIRAREAMEVLGNARSRAQYEARLGVVRRPRETAPSPPAASATQPGPTAPPPGAAPPAAPPATATPGAATPGAPPPAAASVPDYVPPEEILLRARLLLSQARYWDAIQVLENAVPQMEPRPNQHKGRILLAKAYAKNPKWVRRAEEYLHEVVREDPRHVEAHYELGLLYKQVGQVARAQAAFRRVVELKPEHREAAAELGLGDGPSPGGGLLKRLFGRGKAS